MSAKPSPVSPPSAGSSASIVPRPPLLTGHSSGGGVTPARSRPRAIAAATTGARSSPPKASGAIEHGGSIIATRTTGLQRVWRPIAGARFATSETSQDPTTGAQPEPAMGSTTTCLPPRIA